MKKIIVILMVAAIAISPLFRGLFFSFETSVFFTILSLLTVLYLFAKLSEKEALVFNKWLLISGSLLILAYALSFINAVNIRENMGTLIQYTEYSIVSIILYDYYHDKNQKFILTILLFTLLSGFINSVLGIEALSGSFDALKAMLNSGGRRVGAAFQYANTASIYFAVCLFFSLAFLNASSKLAARIIVSGMGNIILLGLLLTGSRGGYIVGFTGLLFFIIFQPKAYKLRSIGFFICMAIPSFIFLAKISSLIGKYDPMTITKYLFLSFLFSSVFCTIYHFILNIIAGKKLKPVTTIIALIIFASASILFILVFKDRFYGLMPQNIIQRFARLSLNDENIYIRLACDSDALKLISGNWMFGLGGGGWPAMYQSVQDIFYTAKAVHNHYLQIFVESGILGFVTFAAMLLISLCYFFRSILRNKIDLKLRIHLSGIFCGFISLSAHSSFDFNITFTSVGLLFWMLMTAAAVAVQERKPNDSDSFKRSPMVSINSWALIFPVIISSSLLSINALYSTASYNAYMGQYSMDERNYASACSYYEKAHSLDLNNSTYIFELTKLYNYFADKSTQEESIQAWRNKARIAAVKCVELNPYYPAYTRILAETFYYSNMPLEGLRSAEKLIVLQPLNIDNYELLARGYLFAANYYIMNKSMDKGKELLLLCSKIDSLYEVNISDSIIEYKKKALKLLEINY